MTNVLLQLSGQSWLGKAYAFATATARCPVSPELGIHVAKLYNWGQAWRLQAEVVPASEKELEG